MRGQGFFGEVSFKGTRIRNLLAVGLALIGFLMFVLSSPSGVLRFSPKAEAQAIAPLTTTFTVNSTADPGTLANCTTRGSQCTLRAAIEAANFTSGDDAINFAIPPTDPNCVGSQCTIFLNTPLPDLSTNITITGPGADKLAVVRANGASQFRILNVTSTGTVTISGLAVSLGVAPPGTFGGAIRNVNNGTVTVANCLLSLNTAPQGGAISNESGGTLNVVNSALLNNGSTFGGGGINSFFAPGIVNVIGSTFKGNHDSTDGGAIISVGATVNVSGSLFFNNTATLRGGAVAILGGLANVSNSTFAGNEASIAGGLYADNGKINLSNSTISNNIASKTGGIFNPNGEGSENFVVKSSIIALNTGTPPDAGGHFFSGGFNLIGKKDGSTGFTASTDQTGTGAEPLDPKLDPNGLRDNGGPTQTIAPLCGSPAIDRGTGVGLTATLTTDQRGSGFPRTFNDVSVTDAPGGDGTDIGAFERQQPCGAVVQFSAANYSVQEDCTTLTVTVNRLGDTSGAASVDYNTADGTATERKDYIKALGTLRFAAGETARSFAVLINEDSSVEGNETFNVSLGNPSGAGLGSPASATVTIVDDASEPATNLIDDPQTFVCQHYHDFLNRQPDASGLAFWTNQIISCGNDASCIEARRLNVSASFFLSIEFQNTGYLVERIYKAGYGDTNSNSTFPSPHQLAVPIVRLPEFLADTQEIGLGVVVGQGNWQQQIEDNKQAFTSEFVQRSRFTTAFPSSMTAAQFVDKLNANAGNPLSTTERNQLLSDLSTNTKTRAQVLRAVAEDQDLNTAEFNRAFVLMQYFGYLRRNPNDPQDSDYTGFDFWLTKLNQFNGNYLNAEMIKAFITSIEYRQRFGQ